MSFTKNDLDKIKSKISLRNELEKKTKLTQKGKDFWCCCPFHEEKTPSCKINEDSNSFYCFGCGAKGDIFTLYTDLYNYKFIDAVKELSQQAGVEINFDSLKKNYQFEKINNILEATCIWFEKNLNDEAAKNCNVYIKKRKLNVETIKKFRLGYSSNSNTNLYDHLKSKGFNDNELIESNVVKLDKNKKIRDYFYNRLIFPILDVRGYVVGFGGRTLDNSNPKYINSPESKFFQKRHLLYNLNNAKNYARKKNNLLICEGYMDVIALNQNGINSVVAPLGTSLTEDQLRLSWNYSSKPTIMFDGDSAGLRASYKSAIMALTLISSKKFIQFITLPNGYDPDSFINEVSLKDLIEKLKKPESLSNFIFNQSVTTISLKNLDEKISFDKYLDELTESIEDKKSQYYYRQEFKSLFFNKIRNYQKKPNVRKILPKNITNSLSKKQNLSFLASAINHDSVKKDILDLLLNTELLDEKEKKFAVEININDLKSLNKDNLLAKFKEKSFNKLIDESLSAEIYELFPYSSPLFDPQKTLEEVKKSINNLNTRLLNLQKINKSLDAFVKNSNSLNWDELQGINIEITDDE